MTKRRVLAVLALTTLLPRPGLAQDDGGGRLIGSWRLVSFEVRFVGEDARPRDIFGPRPFGRIIFTPERTMAAYLSRPDREPPVNDAEAALIPSMIAYTGTYRVEGDRVITAVDGAWSEVYKANEQVRHFAVEGDKLTIRTPEQPSGTMPGKRDTSTLVWERER